MADRPAEQSDFMNVIEELKLQRNEALDRAAGLGGQLRYANQQMQNANETIRELISQLADAQAAAQSLTEESAPILLNPNPSIEEQ
jgi:chromosome segregation ATPase